MLACNLIVNPFVWVVLIVLLITICFVIFALQIVYLVLQYSLLVGKTQHLSLRLALMVKVYMVDLMVSNVFVISLVLCSMCLEHVGVTRDME